MPTQKSGVIQPGRSAAGTFAGTLVLVGVTPPGGTVAPGSRKMVVVVGGTVVVDDRRVDAVRGRLVVGATEVAGCVADVVAGAVVCGVVGGGSVGGGCVDGTLT